MNPDVESLLARLNAPIDADKIYDWIVQKRKKTKSDMPRQGFQTEMEIIDEERLEAAALIRKLSAEVERYQAFCEPLAVRPMNCNFVINEMPKAPTL